MATPQKTAGVLPDRFRGTDVVAGAAASALLYSVIKLAKDRLRDEPASWKEWLTGLAVSATAGAAGGSVLGQWGRQYLANKGSLAGYNSGDMLSSLKPKSLSEIWRAGILDERNEAADDLARNRLQQTLLSRAKRDYRKRNPDASLAEADEKGAEIGNKRVDTVIDARRELFRRYLGLNPVGATGRPAIFAERDDGTLDLSDERRDEFLDTSWDTKSHPFRSTFRNHYTGPADGGREIRDVWDFAVHPERGNDQESTGMRQFAETFLRHGPAPDVRFVEPTT